MKNLNKSTVRKSVVGILCVAMLMSNVYIPVNTTSISNPLTVDAVTIDTADAHTIDISQLNPEVENVKVELSNVIEDNWNESIETNRICRTITIQKDGTYVLTGSNLISYENDFEDTYVDTQIVIPEGVTANLVLDNLNINNDDTKEYGVSSKLLINVRTISPFLIKGTANVYVEDTSKIQSKYTSLFEIDGTLNIKGMNENASLNMEIYSSRLFYGSTSDDNCYSKQNMFNGMGTLNIEDGTFSGIVNTPNIRLTTIYAPSVNNNITFDVKNMNISGGSFGDASSASDNAIQFGDGYSFKRFYDSDSVYDNNVKISGGRFNGDTTFMGDNENVQLSGGYYNKFVITNISYKDVNDIYGSTTNTQLTLNKMLVKDYGYYYGSTDELIIDDLLLNENGEIESYPEIPYLDVVVDDIYVDSLVKVSPKTTTTDYNSDDVVTLKASVPQNFIDKYKENGEIKYQWFKVEHDENTNDIVKTSIENATQETYDVPNNTSGNFEYLCSITYNNGSESVEINSNIVTVTVNKVPNSIELLETYKTHYSCNETITNPTNEQLVLKDSTANISYIWLDSQQNILNEIPTTNGEYTLKIVSNETENFLESEINIPIVLDAHSISKIDAKPSSCIENGNIEYYVCDICGSIFLDKDATQSATLDDVLLPATGHSYGEPTWTWSNDNTSAIATFECANCKDIQNVDATITKEDNKIIAKVIFNDVEYSDSKDIPVETTTTGETTTVTTVTTPNEETTTTTEFSTTTSSTLDTTTSGSDIEPTILLGDVNSDGYVKTNDLLLLKKYLLGLADKDEINFLNSDMNVDKNVKTDDLLILKKFLLGFDI